MRDVSGALFGADAEECGQDLVRADDGVRPLEASAEEGVDAEHRGTTGMRPVGEKLLKVLYVNMPELPGHDAGHGGRRHAGLENGNLAQTIPGAHIIEMHVLARGLGGDFIGAAQHDVEIQVRYVFADDNLTDRRWFDAAVAGESFAGLIVHEGQNASAGKN